MKPADHDFMFLAYMMSLIHGPLLCQRAIRESTQSNYVGLSRYTAVITTRRL